MAIGRELDRATFGRPSRPARPLSAAAGHGTACRMGERGPWGAGSMQAAGGGAGPRPGGCGRRGAPDAAPGSRPDWPWGAQAALGGHACDASPLDGASCRAWRPATGHQPASAPRRGARGRRAAGGLPAAPPSAAAGRLPPLRRRPALQPGSGMLPELHGSCLDHSSDACCCCCSAPRRQASPAIACTSAGRPAASRRHGARSGSEHCRLQGGRRMAADWSAASDSALLAPAWRAGRMQAQEAAAPAPASLSLLWPTLVSAAAAPAMPHVLPAAR